MTKRKTPIQIVLQEPAYYFARVELGKKNWSIEGIEATTGVRWRTADRIYRMKIPVPPRVFEVAEDIVKYTKGMNLRPKQRVYYYAYHTNGKSPTIAAKVLNVSRQSVWDAANRLKWR